jgi:streptogramin lyase
MTMANHSLRLDSGRRRRRLPRALLILALVGAVLCLWAPPAAAAPTITEFHVANVGVPQGIAAGPDGNLWFTWDYSSSPRIGRITPSGAITMFPFPNPSNNFILMSGIAAGPDGNLWFTYQVFTTAADAIGRITLGGAITLTPTPTANGGPTDITAGPDGNMWFTEAIGNVGRITTH